MLGHFASHSNPMQNILNRIIFKDVSLPTPETIKTVQQCNGTLTASDLSLRTGTDLSSAERELLDLANLAGGHIKVDDAGRVVFVFPFPNKLFSVMATKSLRIKLWKTWKIAKKWISYSVRVSFGIMIAISVVLILIAIAVIVIALLSKQSDRNTSSNSNRGSIPVPRNVHHHFHHGFNHGIRPFNIGDLYWFLFWESQYRSSRRNRSYQQERAMPRQQSTPPRDPNPHRDISQIENGANEDTNAKQMNFLEVVFSFLFGDGDPNRNLNKRRNAAIGALIRHNNGVVIAEQVQPYLDECLLSPYLSYESHEGFMIPILKKFGGKPSSNDQGQLVYVFPNLASASSMEPSNINFEDEEEEEDIISLQVIPPPLYEKKWDFSKATQTQLLIAFGLGVVNLLEFFLLSYLLQSVDLELDQMGSIVRIVNWAYSFLMIYAFSYFVTPIIRYCLIQYWNKQIEDRNVKRKENAGIFLRSFIKQEEKNSFAKQSHMKMEISKEDIVYSTQSSYPELELKDFKSHSDQI